MSLVVDRMEHQAKLFVSNQLARFISAQYSRGYGPASRLISVYSDEAKRIGVEQNILVTPTPIKKSAPDFFLDGKLETLYRGWFLTGEDSTYKAGVFSAKSVDVSFPTGMHQVGSHILKEVMPYVLTNPKYYYGLESMRFKRKRPMDEAILLTMPWHHNYYHWMIEIFPRLMFYDRVPDLQRFPLLVPKSAPRFVAESLRLGGYQTKTMFMENGAYRFKKLHMLSMLATPTEVSADAVDWLDKKFTNISSTLTTPRKIYVSRRDAKIRYVSNEPQFAEVLSEFGFETLVMSELSLADQINVFRGAECIVGPHGAAFANLAFSKPGSTVIEFFCRGHFAPPYSRISSIRKMKYGFLVGEPTGNGGFSINPSHLRRVLDQALHTSASGSR